MESQREQQIWRRVLGAERELSIQPLAVSAEILALTYRKLLRQLPHRELEGLWRRQCRQAACLRGIHQMRTGQGLSLKAQPERGDRLATLLRKCYSRSLELAAAYEAYARDPEFGAIFSQLARQEQDSQRLLTELMGLCPEPKQASFDRNSQKCY